MVKKVAVVFGSTGGIGRKVVAQFRDEGYRLGLFSTSETPHQDAYTTAWKGDASRIENVETFLRNVENKFHTLDVVVFSVGSLTENLQDSYTANVVTLANVLEVLGDHFPDTSVFVISSLRSLHPGKNTAYCSSKAAVEMVVKCAREQFPQLRITVIRPGFVNTPLYGDQSRVPYKDGEPYPVVEPQDIAKIISFITQLQEASSGALVEDISVGEVLGERKDLTWRSRM